MTRDPSTTLRIRMATAMGWPAVAGRLTELGRPDVWDTNKEAAVRRIYKEYLERHDAVALVAEGDG